MNIKYRPLKAFLLAVETRSFTHGADRLGVTQPSFTALIQDLENVLEVKLFERTTRSIELTKAGEEFLARIDRPIADLEEAYSSMLDLAAVKRGSIVMGALPSTSLTLIPQALGALQRVHPAIHVRVVEAQNDQLLMMLRTNQVEFALATLLADAPDLAFQPLLADVFCAVYAPDHPIGLRHTLHWNDLVQCNLILLSQGSSARDQFDRAVNVDDASAGLRYDVTHMATAVQLVRQGMGVALLPRLALPALHLEGLTSRQVDDQSARRTIGVLHRRDRHLTAAAQAFIAQVTQVVARLKTSIDPG